MKDVPYDFGGLFVWTVDQALAALERGELDAAFWATGPHYPNGDVSPVLYGFLCLIPEVAERMRRACAETLQLFTAEQAAR